MLLLWSGAASAHFLTDAASREIHVLEETDFGEPMVMMRFPLTLAFASALADRTSPAEPVEAPFLAVKMVDGVPLYYFDQPAYENDFDGFLAYLLKDYRFIAGGREIEPELGILSMVSVRDAIAPPPGLESLLMLLELCTGSHDADRVANLDVMLLLYLPDVPLDATLTIEVTTPPVATPPAMTFDTHVTDHRVSPPVLVTHEGLVPPPVVLDGRRWQALPHWLWQGIAHVLGGLDHVLFVLCLALAAPGPRGLIWSVAGFAIGHSVTLAAGVLGFVPQVPWFAPAVDLGMALSIVVMGALVLVGRAGSVMRFALTTALAAGLGLLHGFGFAFVLAPMIGGRGLAMPLAGFNIGVEIGQLLLVSVIFALLTVIDRKSLTAGRILRLTAASIAVLIALSMSVERTEPTYAAFTGGA